MYEPTADRIIGASWIIHTAMFFLLVVSFSWSARSRGHRILQWPASLWWMFSAFFLSWCLISIDTFVIRTLPSDGYWGIGDRTKPMTIFLRILPIPIGIAIFRRMRRFGSTLDS